MENSLYYTFSTIAQSLAGLMGLLAAFALFRLQSIDNDFRQKAELIARSFTGDKEINNQFLSGEYLALLASIDQRVAGGRVGFNTFEMSNIESLRGLIPVRTSIVSSLKLAFIASAATMIISVALLALVPLLKDCPAILWLVVGAFIFCLGLHMRLVVNFLS